MQTMPTADISHYTYRVTWSVEDQEFVATCLEFPSLSWLAVTQVDALTGLENLIADIVQDMTTQGEAIPEPLAERTYSGKFNLRVGEALHRRLAIEAAEEKLEHQPAHRPSTQHRQLSRPSRTCRDERACLAIHGRISRMNA